MLDFAATTLRPAYFGYLRPLIARLMTDKKKVSSEDKVKMRFAADKEIPYAWKKLNRKMELANPNGSFATKL